MKGKVWRNALFFGATSVLSLGVVAGLWYMIAKGGSALPTLGQAPNFTAVNVNGQPVSFQNLNGKVRVVTWFYTHCPDVCPMTAVQLSEVQQQLEQKGQFGKDVVIVSINIDPTRDTLPVIKQWSSLFHPDYNGWYFLRATPAQTPAILKAWGIYVGKSSDNPELLTHTAQTELIDQNGNIRKIYGNNLDPNQVVSDIENLLQGGPFGL